MPSFPRATPSAAIAVLDSGRPEKKTESRIPELDGVRAVAIWMVLLAHMFFGLPVPAGAYDHVPGFLLQILGHGWLGVDLFFVLSGFLITGILLDSREKPHYFKNFYSRRALRILPVYMATVAVMVLCYAGSARFFLASAFFLANFAYLMHIPEPHGGGVLWSLAVEEHFYLLWPWLVRFLNRRTLVTLGLSLLVIEPAARGLAAAHGVPVEGVIYDLSFFRFDALALGGLLAVWYRSRWNTPANALKLAGGLIAAAALVTIAGLPFGILKYQVPAAVALRYTQAQLVFGGFMMAVLARRASAITAPFRSGFAVLSADLSYCIYLIHLGIGDAYEHFFARSFTPWMTGVAGPLTAVLARGAIILAATFVAAMLSRRYLEQPFLRLKRHFV